MAYDGSVSTLSLQVFRVRLLQTVLPLWVAMARWSGLHTTLLLSRRVVVKPARRRKRPAILVTLSGTETDPGNDSWTEMTPRLSDWQVGGPIRGHVRLCEPIRLSGGATRHRWYILVKTLLREIV